MIKLKGGDGDDKHSIMNGAARRMNLPQLNGAGKSKAMGSGSAGESSGPGSYAAAQQMNQANQSSASQLADRLGMPSAKQKKRQEKDWANKSNRINVGGPVFIRSARERNDGAEEDAQADSDEENTAHRDGDDGLGVEATDEEKLLESLREKRLMELKASTAKRLEFESLGHGSLSVIVEDEFLPAVTQSKYSVCHFFHPNFERCKILDSHLTALAKKHFATRFLAINAEKTPFFVNKLQVKTLPTVIFFKDGIAIDRLIGFEDLGGSDDFSTAALEKRIAKAGVIITVDKVTEEDQEKAAEDRRKAASRIREAKIKQFINDDSDESDDGD